MYLKKEANVLISTVILLSLLSVLGCFMYKMMRNNNELSSLYKFDKNIYNLDEKEEEILYKFMKELNKDRKEKMSNSLEEDINSAGVFEDDFDRKLDGNSLKYHKDDDKLFLITNIENDISRKREILYKIRDDKILLIPTYKFHNNDE